MLNKRPAPYSVYIHCADRPVDEVVSDSGTWDYPRSTLTSARPVCERKELVWV